MKEEAFSTKSPVAQRALKYYNRLIYLMTEPTEFHLWKNIYSKDKMPNWNYIGITMKDTKLHFVGAEDVLAASTIAKPGGKKLAFKSKKLFHQYRVIIIMTSIFMSF